MTANDAASVTESGPSTDSTRSRQAGLRAGKLASKAIGVKLLRMEDGVALFAAG